MKTHSDALFKKAKTLIPGGVNSPVRAFGSVGSTPFFVRKAAGSKVWDEDGNRYIDYVASWGPMILGHAHPAVVDAIRKAARRGTSYGAPTAAEVEMAAAITRAFPSMDLVRMVSSGTEATMSAIRLARGTTGREKILKFEGCYHGHADSLLVKAGSGVATLGIPGSPGVPKGLAELTVTVPFNDLAAVKTAVKKHGKELACVIVEPAAGNMGLVPPAPGFLKGLRELTAAAGIVLIFDEVISGFRLRFGGFQHLVGVRPDLTCLGKIIGGGLPVGAFGGRREIMESLAPAGAVYQAGTLSGNPLAMAAGLATLGVLENESDYRDLDRKTRRLCDGMMKLFRKKGLAVTLTRCGSMFTVFFTDGDVTDFTSALRCDTGLFARYFNAMLRHGVSLPPSQFETAFVSFAHSSEDIDRTLEACGKALASL
ncbi:MAG: glutamate-1-semialdehyde 2,1-aminomutase [Syntrophales bacterium]|jgi:glutamate-1-semialdehyde 2,1-aminomutase|nr:glutamate-1-semialdehyde 2,1-aminomutase [Syntrophales bacterium]